MSTNNSNEWVREGTPREDWDADTDYGVEIDPAEWDDYSEEQTVHVATPAAAREYEPPTAHSEDEDALATSSPAPARDDAPQTPPEDGHSSPDEHLGAPTTGAGRVADEEYRSPEDDTQYEQTEVRARPVIPAGFVADQPSASSGSPASGADSPTSAVRDESTPDGHAQEQSADIDESVAADHVAADHIVEEGMQRAQHTAEPAAVPDVASEDELTAHHDVFAQPDDEEPAPLDAEDAPPETAMPTETTTTATTDSLYRPDPEPGTELDEEAGGQTQVIDQSRLREEEAAEQERVARLQEQRHARDARLGVVAAPEEGGVRTVEKPVKRQADRFLGATALVLLRLITAAVIGALGYQVLQDIDRASTFLATTVIPEPRLVAWVLGFALVSLAVLLIVGLGVRIVGFLLTAVAIASLATIRWGAFNVFQEGVEGFLGDRTLLTAGVGLVFIAFGAGRFSIDGAIYASRQRSKAQYSE